MKAKLWAKRLGVTQWDGVSVLMHSENLDEQRAGWWYRRRFDEITRRLVAHRFGEVGKLVHEAVEAAHVSFFDGLSDAEYERLHAGLPMTKEMRERLAATIEAKVDIALERPRKVDEPDNEN